MHRPSKFPGTAVHVFHGGLQRAHEIVMGRLRRLGRADEPPIAGIGDKFATRLRAADREDFRRFGASRTQGQVGVVELIEFTVMGDKILGPKSAQQVDEFC